MQPAGQDIINRIKQVNNILVTVKSNPSVDELSAALGLTIALNSFGKHATAVFSGEIPNAMSFLKPQKIFENNVHSLRDFIISLNKEKADKLRFAKDGEIVKIYITPYKSTITSQDLSYEEGDFNVEMVLAIGISAQEELDSVISAHGRILHEATVATINPGAAAGQLGSINWSEVDLTSASAMVLVLLQNLGLTSGITPEIATALLTGIVAGTDRFSNQKTTPKIMELSAQLMSSGADHQLVTSSIGATSSSQSTNLNNVASQPLQTAAPTTLPEPEISKDQEISLDLHAPQMPVQATPVLTSATNTAPMVSSQPTNFMPTAEPVAQVPTQTSVLPPPTPQPSSTVSTEISHDNNQNSFNEALGAVLPQPVDTSQAIFPSEPPQSTLSQQPSQAQSNTETQAAAPLESQGIVPSSTTSEADRILSEIDNIYSAQPFDPANNPREDLGTSIVTPEEIDQPLPSSVLAIDTSVQQDQALSSNLNSTENTEILGSANIPSLPAIPEAKQETINSADILGTSSVVEQINNPTTAGQIPGIQMPNIAPPPPPPLESALPTFTPTIDFNDTPK